MAMSDYREACPFIPVFAEEKSVFMPESLVLREFQVIQLFCELGTFSMFNI